MDIASVVAQPPTPGVPATDRGFDELASEDFFQLIITDLLNQDPLEPMDNDKLLQQLSSIRDMELNQQITESLRSLMDQQRSGSATNLIGQFVVGRNDAGGHASSGVVTGVHFDAGGAVQLNLGQGGQMPLNQVSDVTSVDQIRAALLNSAIEAEVLESDGPRTIRGKVQDVTLEAGRVMVKLDSDISVPLSALKHGVPGIAA